MSKINKIECDPQIWSLKKTPFSVEDYKFLYEKDKWALKYLHIYGKFPYTKNKYKLGGCYTCKCYEHKYTNNVKKIDITKLDVDFINNFCKVEIMFSDFSVYYIYYGLVYEEKPTYSDDYNYNKYYIVYKVNDTNDLSLIKRISTSNGICTSKKLNYYHYHKPYYSDASSSSSDEDEDEILYKKYYQIDKVCQKVIENCTFCKDSDKPYYEALCTECRKYVNEFKLHTIFGEKDDSICKMYYCLQCIKKYDAENKF